MHLHLMYRHRTSSVGACGKADAVHFAWAMCIGWRITFLACPCVVCFY